MSSVWHRSLRNKIEERVQREADSLLEGGAPDFPAYKARCAYIAGLRDALRISEEIDVEILGAK